MLDLLSRGGVIMYFILLLSIIAASIILERLLYFRKIKVDEEKFIGHLKSAIEKSILKKH